MSSETIDVDRIDRLLKKHRHPVAYIDGTNRYVVNIRRILYFTDDDKPVECVQRLRCDTPQIATATCAVFNKNP